MAETVTGALLPGEEPVLEDARVLLALSGRPSRAAIFAAPTTLGRVCWHVHPVLPGGSCADDFGFVDGDGAPGACGDVYVFGLLPDGVVAVDAYINRRAHRAQMGANSFGLIAPGAAIDLDGFVLRYRDGRTAVTRFGLWRIPKQRGEVG